MAVGVDTDVIVVKPSTREDLAFETTVINTRQVRKYIGRPSIKVRPCVACDGNNTLKIKIKTNLTGYNPYSW